MWSIEVLESEFMIKEYEEGQFPFVEMFLSNSFHSMCSSNFMRKLPRTVSESFIKHRQSYMLLNCKSIALFNSSNSDSVYSYIFYMLPDAVRDAPCLYFMYTKQSFRGKGLIKYLLGFKFREYKVGELYASYPFPIFKQHVNNFKKSLY